MKLSPTPSPKQLPPIRGFLLGYSGSGKSSAVFPLAIEGPIKGCTVPGPGLEIRMLDFDAKGAEMAYSILGMMRDNKLISPLQHDEALGRIDLEVCQDKMSTVTQTAKGKMTKAYGIKGSSTGWTKAATVIDKWESTNTPNHLVFVDSLTYCARTAVSFCQELQGNVNKELTWREYMCPQNKCLDLMLYLSGLPCNVLISGHQEPTELTKPTDKVDDKGVPIEEHMDTIVVPVSIGRAPGIKLPARFNHLLLFATEGKNEGTKRFMFTTPKFGVVTKTPFFNAKRSYPITTALVEYFALRKGVPGK